MHSSVTPMAERHCYACERILSEHVSSPTPRGGGEECFQWRTVQCGMDAILGVFGLIFGVFSRLKCRFGA